MNIDDATKQACKESTLLDALTWICVWESEPVVKQVKKNLTDSDGKGWDTCFKMCLKKVIDEYNKPVCSNEKIGILDRLKMIVGLTDKK